MTDMWLIEIRNRTVVCEENSFWSAGICSTFKMEVVVRILRCDTEFYVEEPFIKIQTFWDVKPCHMVNT